MGVAVALEDDLAGIGVEDDRVRGHNLWCCGGTNWGRRGGRDEQCQTDRQQGDERGPRTAVPFPGLHARNPSSPRLRPPGYMYVRMLWVECSRRKMLWQALR